MKLGFTSDVSNISGVKLTLLDENLVNLSTEKMEDPKESESEAVNTETEEADFTEVEYLDDDEVSCPNETFEGTDSEGCVGVEYLEEDSEDPDVIDVEFLDSTLEDDSEDDIKRQKRRKLELDRELGEVESALFDLLKPDPQDVASKSNSKSYTKDELLDMLGSSPERNSEGDTIKSKLNRLKRLKNESLKETIKSKSQDSLKKALRMSGMGRLSSDDVYLTNDNSEDESINQKNLNSLFIDESRFMPANYEDIDNEGVFDYMEDDVVPLNNDLLTERKSDKKSVKNRDDVMKAVGGINKLLRVDKKFTNLSNGKPKRGRPRKADSILREIQLKKENDNPYVDSHLSYLESVLREEPVDDADDDDYIPGQTFDWMKNKKSKDKFYCRMCGNSFKQLNAAITHALIHRVPGKAVFPCVLCAYGFTTYTELQKHMKQEHTKKKPVKKTPTLSDSGISKPRGRPGRKPKASYPSADAKIEIIDDEEVCDVEMLEEWLEDEEDYAPPEVKKEIKKEEPIKVEEQDLEEPFDELKEILNYEEQDFIPSGDEEWLLEEDEEEAAIASDDSSITKETKSSSKKKKNRPKYNFKCDSCLINFCSLENLKKHNCVSAGPKYRSVRGAYRCALCGQSFMTRKRLAYHKTFHQVELLEMKLACDKCDKKFNTEGELYDHINNEHNIDFQCTHEGCNKRFHLRSALRAHARIHGKKCHQCNVCGKKFYDIHNLKEHNITHLSVKPFQCHICLKFLNRRSRLRMHLLSHESFPIENYVLTCKHCKMAFGNIADAEKHVLESEDCCNNILSSYDGPDFVNILCKLEEDRNANKLLMIAVDKQMDEMHFVPKADINAVEEAVKESLSQNGIINEEIAQSLPNTQITEDPSTTTILSGDESIKSLFGEVGAVKFMLTEDGNLKQILDDNMPSLQSKEHDLITIPADGDIPIIDQNHLVGVVKNVKNLLTEDGTVISTTESDDTFLMENILKKEVDEIYMEVPMENIEFRSALDEKSQEVEQPKPKTDVNFQNTEISGLIKKTQYTEEQLVSQLKENSKNFIEAIKIKVVYRCEYCEKSFYTKEALTGHRKTHDGLRNPFICNVCNAAFSTFARCTSHKTTHGFYRSNTGDDKEKNTEDISAYESFPVIKYFLCQHCNKTFLHWPYLQAHKRHKHSQFTYYFNCRVCGAKFTDSWSLNSHRRKVHADIINNKKYSNTSYKCQQCGEGYNKRDFLAKHLLEVHADSTMMDQKNRPGSFVCSICQKMYHTKVGLEGHLRTHSGGVYLCDLCGNGFAHRAGLDSHHKRVHLREQNYVCRECGAQFFSPGDLDIHRRNHTGEKPFPCDFCEMSFRTRGRRKEHHRTHTGERPFACDICSMTFPRSNAMKNHRLTHTGDKRLRCPHCSKQFHVISNLKSHIRSKHPEEFELTSRDDLDFMDTTYEPSKLNTDSQHIEVQNNLSVTEPGLLVMEDVIIEDESEAILRQEDGPTIINYTYSPDNIVDVGSRVMSERYNPGTIINNVDSKVHLQIVSGGDDGQSLLYTVEEENATDADMHLIEGAVEYALVDDIGDDPKEQQFAIIDGDQFIKEETDEQESVYYA